MIIELALTLATVIPVTNKREDTIILRREQSAVISKFSMLEFEDFQTNSTLTFTENSKVEKVENIFVSPVKKTTKVKMKLRMGGKVSPIPVNTKDIVYLDE